jgi:hypothetical protein
VLAGPRAAAGDEVPEANGKSILWGHLLTPTSSVLKRGDWSVGTLAVAYGLSDWLTIGSSPWLWGAYNMAQVSLRAALPAGDDRHWQLGLQGQLFKTYLDSDSSRYRQSSVTVTPVLSARLSSVWNVHLAATAMYFWNDDRPFSLRMQNGDSGPWMLALSALQIADLTERWRLQAEVGTVGLNYVDPYLHTGLSMAYQAPEWTAQIGLSSTRHLGSPRQALQPTSFKAIDSVHPEVQVQVFF